MKSCRCVACPLETPLASDYDKIVESWAFNVS